MSQNTTRTDAELTGVTLLGNQDTKYDYDYNPEVLETFPNKHTENNYLVTFDGYEFTSLCPKTGQPDFANVFISYIPIHPYVPSRHPAYIARFSKLVRSIIAQCTVYSITIAKGITTISKKCLVVVYSVVNAVVRAIFFL